MNASQTKIIRLESTIHAMEELLTVSETAFLEGATKLEEANEKLKVSIREHEKLENDIEQILDASSDAIRVVDKNYKIIYASKSFSRLKGNPGNIIGKKCYKATPEKECFTEGCPLKRILKTGKKFAIEKEIESVDGTKTPYLIDVIPYTDSAGNFIGIIKNYRNITNEKKARKIAEENALQQGRIEMANNMLHDIGNAMTEISVYVLKPQMERKWREIQLLYQLRDMFTASEQELISVFGEEKQRSLNDFMKALISSFEERNSRHLDFSRKISAAVGHVCSVLDLQRHYLREKTSLLATEIKLSTIINDTLVMMSGGLHKRSIQVSLDTGDKNLKISGDQTRLIRVFMNIIKNICEAFDEVESKDKRKLEISITPDESKKEIKVIFSDNGIGFPKKTGNELFKRGFTSKPDGSGIGLHECRSIIESHGGTMTIESNGINTGALTVITFPVLK